MATITKRATKGSPLTNDEVDANFENLNTDKLETSGGSVTGDISFGDNDKAIFGAGSDLQIYHTGSNSIIDDLGTGNLLIRSDGTAISLQVNSKNSLRAVADEDVELYYNGNQKLATTNTGIDVTGTVTADGLTVDGDSQTTTLKINTASSAWADANADDLIIRGTDIGVTLSSTGTGNFYFGDGTGAQKQGQIKYDHSNDSMQFSTAESEAMRIDSSGNVGIGTSSPSFPLDIAGSDFVGIHYERSGTSSPAFRLSNATTGSLTQIEGSNSGDMIFKNGAGSLSESMRIDSSGNVGIATTSPSAPVSIDDSDLASNSNSRLIALSGGRPTDRYAAIGVEKEGTSNQIGMTFYTTNNTATPTERVRIDANGNVGIGTTSPLYSIHSSTTSGNQFIAVTSDTSSSAGVLFGDTASAVRGQVRYFNADDSMGIYTDGNERMRIDSSGNVGIGTTDAFAVLTPSNSGALTLDCNDDNYSGFGLFIAPSTVNTNTVNTAIGFGRSNGRKYAAIGMQTYGDADQNGLNFYVQPSSAGSSAVLTEAMRIDSSGNLLVGTTDSLPVTNNDSNGIALRADGNAQFSRASAATARFNRKTDDGEIVSFGKDGTTVGSIGTSGGYLIVGSDDTALRFHSGVDLIHPSTSTGGSKDAAIDLGNSSNRFKDLYLSGGVYLGGTGSANHLDDYEEGTWTATLRDADSGGNTSSTVTANYTKIGRLVHINIALGSMSVTGLTSGNILYITGLPFTSSASNEARLSADLRNVSYTSGNTPTGLLGASRTYLYFIEVAPSASFNPLEVSEYSSSSQIFVTGTYFT